MSDEKYYNATDYVLAWCVNIFCVNHRVMGTKSLVVDITDVHMENKCPRCGCRVHTDVEKEADEFVKELLKKNFT